MRIIYQAAVAAGLLGLAACGDSPTEEAAENIEAAGENQADMYEEMADNATTDAGEDALENRADQVEDAAEEAADNVADMEGDNTVGM